MGSSGWGSNQNDGARANARDQRLYDAGAKHAMEREAKAGESFDGIIPRPPTFAERMKKLLGRS